MIPPVYKEKPSIRPPHSAGNLVSWLRNPQDVLQDQLVGDLMLQAHHWEQLFLLTSRSLWTKNLFIPSHQQNSLIFLSPVLCPMSKWVFSYSFSFFHRDKLGGPMHIFVNYLYYIRRAYSHSPVGSEELLSESPAVTILGNSLASSKDQTEGDFCPQVLDFLVYVLSRPFFFSFPLTYSIVLFF